MANRIQIRHGSGAPSTSNLLSYELGWDTTNHILYINDNGTIRRANDSLFLPLGGGTMSGPINRYYSTATTQPMITLRSNSKDVYLFQLGSATSTSGNFSSHYKLLYKGTGNTPNRYLQLVANNATTDTIALQFDENGNATFSNTVNANISGNAEKAISLANSYTSTTRLTNADISHITNGGIIHFKITNSMADGSILHFYWDDSNNWDGQLYIPTNYTNSMQWRNHSAAGVWGSAWKTLLDNTNVGSFTTVSNVWTGGTTAGPTIKTTVNGVVSTAVAIPSASTTSSGIVTTGNQSFAGRKTISLISPTIFDGTSNTNRYKHIYFNNNSMTLVGDLRYDSGDATNVSGGTFQFLEYSPNSTADTTTTGFYEQYNLPTAQIGLNANTTYGIVTTPTSPRRIYVTTTEAVPSGAVAGDIVLVKV